MHLAEEYLSRHSISVPIIKHVQQGTLFLRNESMMGIMVITYRTENTGPGKYHIRHLRPVHDGYSVRHGLFETAASDQVEWDNYEEYILKFIAQSGRPTAILDVKDIVLSAWEMFVYCCDSSLAQYATNDPFFQSLDKELSSPDRHNGYSKFLSHIQKADHGLFELWSRDFLGYVRNSCHWLAKLMDGKGAA